MTDNDKTLTLFTTRIRQMILRYNEMKEKNEELYAKIGAQESEMARLRERLEEAQKDYESLRMAKIMEISDRDIEVAKRKIAGLIRDVNKCITLLSE